MKYNEKIKLSKITNQNIKIKDLEKQIEKIEAHKKNLLLARTHYANKLDPKVIETYEFNKLQVENMKKLILSVPKKLPDDNEFSQKNLATNLSKLEFIYQSQVLTEHTSVLQIVYDIDICLKENDKEIQSLSLKQEKMQNNVDKLIYSLNKNKPSNEDNKYDNLF